MVFCSKRVLLVEDSADDAALVLRVHRRLGRTEPVEVICDPELVMESLKENGIPSLLILDLKLPRVSGLELLRDIRAHMKYRAMPIVVLTASDEPQDVCLSYEYGANSCLHKHVEYEAAMEELQTAFDYWLKHNLTGGEIARESA